MDLKNQTQKREIKFRFWDNDLKKMFERKPAYNDFSHPNIIPYQFTGLCDKKGTEIYEGDQIGQWCEVDGMLIQSCLQVFWNEFTASYHVDNSYSQDKSYSEELWQALDDGDYEVVGNIHQKN